MKLAVKNWTDFQHYKDRSPPWIKLHKGLLDNFEYQSLPTASRAIAPMLWLIASESPDGSFDGTPAKLAFRLRLSVSEVSEALKPLIDSGFFVAASDSLAECLRDACLETEREESKRQSRGEAEEKTPREKASRGSRLSAGTTLSDEWMNEARRLRPDLPREKISAIFDEFRDYWSAKPGKDGTKTDWLATWRNWVRREKGFSRQQSTGNIKPINGRDARAASYLEQQGYGQPTVDAGRDITGEAVRVA